MTTPASTRRRVARRPLPPALALALLGGVCFNTAWATTPLSDRPVLSGITPPGNVVLALSVEYPTVVSVAHLDTEYDPTKVYVGYFDPNKCYVYNHDANEALRHFAPAGQATSRTCTGTHAAKWSGNFMNWATMQTIDPFRMVLTGGYRVRDNATETWLEKAYASGQGGTSNFPDRSFTGGSKIAEATPMDTWSRLTLRVQGIGNKLRFTNSASTSDLYSDALRLDYNPAVPLTTTNVYELSVRVKVCDSGAAAGGLEPNCTAYPGGTHKPTGLLHQYAERMRFSSFGYLNDQTWSRDGAVLRARQKYVGPTYRLTPTANPLANAAAEWDANTGVFVTNPDAADAAASTTEFGVTISDSGVINYLNKFGQVPLAGGVSRTTSSWYKSLDPAGELYYAALRYLKNQGNVPEWSAMGAAATNTKTVWMDGFPVITTWGDPLQYSCQRSVVLGIGDVNTHRDKNLPGVSVTTGEPTKPTAVSGDTMAVGTATDKVGALHGGPKANLGSALNDGSGQYSGYHIAGMAYLANTTDIRPDDPNAPKTRGKQTVQTFWLDVLEYSTYRIDNQYYLATKFGGFTVPDDFDPWARTTDLPQAWWSTSGETAHTSTQPRPDNYFVASRPDTVVSGLTRAFARINEGFRQFTTAFSTSAPQVAQTGVASYSAKYEPSDWSGDVTASTTSFNAVTGQPSQTVAWTFATRLDAQAAGAGWDTGRRIVTWNTATSQAVAFRHASLATAQRTALDTSYRTGDDSADYVNYLRGDRQHETASTTTGSARAYRTRARLMGDIVNSRPRVVGAPNEPWSSATNPGYAAFKTAHAGRTPVVYVGTNAGMLHAINGNLSGTGAGTELFAYVPGSLAQGPTGSPGTTGLAARGDPNFQHKFFVDASPTVIDIDFSRTAGSGSTTPDWRTLLVSGLGKGGKSYFAIDVTDPGSWTSESAVAGKVLWEFTDPDLGYTYGEPQVVKTAQHGWVVVFGSGYNNTDGVGYIYIVNPRTGALIQKISTGAGAPASQAGLAHVQAFLLDRTDGTADSLYAGDLLGNLWRLDLKPPTGAYAAPTRIATLADSSGTAQPVTTRPLVVVQPDNQRRWVTVGTGKLLDTTDLTTTQQQTMYAIVDGTARNFSATAPTGFTYPLARNRLRALTNLQNPIVLNLSNEMGWYLDLDTVAGGPSYRVNTESTSFFGVLEFLAMSPASSDPCRAGQSRAYAIDLGTGQSNLVANDGTTLAYFTVTEGVATEQRSLSVSEANQLGRRRLVVCTDQGGCQALNTRTPPGVGLRRLNWRELILAD
ncbi:MAG: pilus assembly protein [Rubrivivax sp.]|nr:pilus assembly protein [Rubrivivax sp.]